ncbi:probable protein phosphatase 2C 47 isoform X1 [Prosopis cineraria]|uniref:probable protein phosphatase 2C 47 isoform X1 n=2 Tax=Prosopis cineraria TaxID=364024 RepID=UPI00240EEA14|nr:probable protein phosphatase 2C 47 isoform X1 [Prosopis cineraria]
MYVAGQPHLPPRNLIHNISDFEESARKFPSKNSKRNTGLPLLDVQYIPKASGIRENEEPPFVSPSPGPPGPDKVRASDAVSAPLLNSQQDVIAAKQDPHASLDSALVQFVPSIRSGSYADIGPRRYMEDEHIMIDDLSSHLGSLYKFPKPSAFYGVFDGHGGSEAAVYVRENVIRFIFEDASFPQSSKVDNLFLQELENSLRKAFLLADSALADDRSVSSSSGTTALTALIFGRLLMVTNVGDCRAVLCRKGEAIDMSQDHRPIYPSERRRVEESGGYIDDGYLNGLLSVTRALGDWDMKLPRGSPTPLIAEPEFRRVVLTEDDEFLIIGCDGIWDVMSSQHAVSLVRRSLRRHDDPEKGARDLVMEALRLNAFDNLTVVVVCFTPPDYRELSPAQRLTRCSLSTEALGCLRSLLEGSASN